MIENIITVDMDKRCAECGTPGAVGSGICLRCATKAISPKPLMKSRQGKALQQRYAELLATTQRDLKRAKGRA